MDNLKYMVAFGLVLTLTSLAFSQTRQRDGQGFNPGQMIEAEKKEVYEKLSNLTEDQKEVIEIVYDDYAEALGKLREEANGDFQAMRTKMMSVREEKDESMKAVLTEEQYKEYSALMEERRQRRRVN